MLTPVLEKNDRKANILIIAFSIFVFTAVALLSEINLKGKVQLGFDVHIFAQINAAINSVVTILLIAALVAVRRKNFVAHKNMMLTAMILSLLFLLSYIAHHLLAGEARFGDVNHDGIADAAEKAAAGNLRYFYFFILATHIPLAGIIMPFILYTAYRSLTGEYAKHRKMAKYTWPLWLYVSVTGVLVYFLIAPYYA